MNKKLLIAISIATLVHTTIIPMGYVTTPLGYAVAPVKYTYRKIRDWVWGKNIGQAYWEANETELNDTLNQFKLTSDDAVKTKILENVMTKSSAEYETQINELQQKIDELKSNYRKSMSYIIEKFQAESPDSTIIYLPDNKLVGILKKDSSDEEKTRVMFNLLQKANDLVKAKAKQASGVSNLTPTPNRPAAPTHTQGQSAGSTVHVHVNPTPTTQTIAPIT